ncbi:MAG: tetratricopeptide repeat protein [Alphaproteobacteria bacterium]
MQPPKPERRRKPRDYKEALTLIAQGRCADALPLLQRAAARSPEDPDIYNQIGLCNAKLGRYRESLEAYIQALTIDPNHKEARANLGELLLLLDRPADAQEQLRQLSLLCPRGCAERETLQKAIDDYKAKHAG